MLIPFRLPINGTRTQGINGPLQHTHPGTHQEELEEKEQEDKRKKYYRKSYNEDSGGSRQTRATI